MNTVKLIGKVALVLFILFLAGTMPSMEPNRRLVAEAAGIDYHDGKFILSAYGVTDFGDNGIKGRKCVSEGTTLAEAADNFVYTEGKDLFLKQCKVVAVGPGAAQRMEEVVGYFVATRDLNYFARIILTPNEAATLFDTESLKVNDLYYLTEKQKKGEETYSNRMITFLKQSLRDEGDYLLPMLDVTGTEVSSVTAFSAHRKAAVLTREEYRLVELLSGLRTETDLTIGDEMLHISGATRQLAVSLEDGVLQAEEIISLSAEGSDGKRSELSALLKAAAEKMALAQCDVFGVYLTFKMADHGAYLAEKEAERSPYFDFDLSVHYASRKDGSWE